MVCMLQFSQEVQGVSKFADVTLMHSYNVLLDLKCNQVMFCYFVEA